MAKSLPLCEAGDFKSLSTFSKIRYLGAGRYGVGVKDQDYKSAEARMKKVVESVEKSLSKSDSTVVFERK